MKLFIFGCLVIAIFMAAISLAGRLDEERAIKSLVRAARAERLRPYVNVSEEEVFGEYVEIPSSARIPDMPQREWV